MSNKKERRELTKSCTDLLEFTAGDLIPMLENKPKLVHVKQEAFGYYSEKTKEHFQVQIVVTRAEHDFLDFLQVEEMSEYGS